MTDREHAALVEAFGHPGWDRAAAALLDSRLAGLRAEVARTVTDPEELAEAWLLDVLDDSRALSSGERTSESAGDLPVGEKVIATVQKFIRALDARYGYKTPISAPRETSGDNTSERRPRATPDVLIPNSGDRDATAPRSSFQRQEMVSRGRDKPGETGTSSGTKGGEDDGERRDESREGGSGSDSGRPHGPPRAGSGVGPDRQGDPGGDRGGVDHRHGQRDPQAHEVAPLRDGAGERWGVWIYDSVPGWMLTVDERPWSGTEAEAREEAHAETLRSQGRFYHEARPLPPSPAAPAPAREEAACADLRHVCGKCGFHWPERSAYDELTAEGMRLRDALEAERSRHTAEVAALRGECEKRIDQRMADCEEHERMHAAALEAERAAHAETKAKLEDASADYEKFYIKARVYGAIACKFREALEAMVGNVYDLVIRKEALEWRHSVRGGVPLSAINEIDHLLQTGIRAQSELAEAHKRHEAQVLAARALSYDAAIEKFAQLRRGGYDVPPYVTDTLRDLRAALSPPAAEPPAVTRQTIAGVTLVSDPSVPRDEVRIVTGEHVARVKLGAEPPAAGTCDCYRPEGTHAYGCASGLGSRA